MSLAEQMAAAPAMQAVFAPRATVQAMLDAEAALARAGASAGLMPAEAAHAIAAACRADKIDVDALAADAARAGTVVIPLVAWLKGQVPAARNFVHLGGTSQDIIDTGLVLQLRQGLRLLQDDLGIMADAAASLAARHAATPMAGRTLLQPALPITLGLKAATWLVMIDDARQAITHAADQALVLQCGGASGSLDAAGADAIGFAEAFGEYLSLKVPVLPWHTRRGPLLRLAAATAGATGTAGKIGTDISLLMQAEIGEVSEPAAPGRGGSSAMAHKRNPTLSIAARAAATRMPGLLASLLGAMDQEHERAAGGWQAEGAIWPALMLAASGAFAAMAEALPGLVADPARMAENLARLPGTNASPAIPALIARALEDHHMNHAKQSPHDR
jgi:3-carboxy-cis,cis-muconate cycloisomerase